MDALYLVGIAVLAVFGFVFAVVLFNFFGVWLRARIANAPVGMGKMVGMRLRRVPVGLIVDSRITAVKAGIEIPSDPLEAHYLAGGDVSQVILALIAADKAGISLDFNRARGRRDRQRDWVGRFLQRCPGKSRPHLKGGAGQRARQQHRV